MPDDGAPRSWTFCKSNIARQVSSSRHPRNARTHSRKQIRQIADSIRNFGFTNPVLIDDERT